VAQLQVDRQELLLTQSTFDTGTEGWTVSRDATNFVYVPQGYLTASTRSTTDWSWIAPAKFLGNMAGAYRGWLEFDLKQSATNGLPASTQADVTLTGGSGSLRYQRPIFPGTNCSSFKIPLDETVPGWSGNNGPPSQLDMISVLSSLSDVRIRGRFLQTTNSVSLDNVGVVAYCTNNNFRLIVQKFGADRIVVQWPLSAVCLRLETTPSLLQPRWTPVPTPVPASETNSVPFYRTNAMQFFRLAPF